MKRISTIFFTLFAMVAGLGCADEHNEFAGDPMIRYVGKCTGLTVSPGWERVELNWKNNVDPTIDKIKVVWSDADVARDTLLDGRSESVNIKHLSDATYAFEVYAMDKEGNLSLAETNYGRPFTYTHESVAGFSKVVTKYFPVKDNLILFFGPWQDNLKEVTLNYYEGNEEKNVPLTEEEVSGKFMMLEHVNFDFPVLVMRKAEVEGCLDEVVFEPHELDMSERTLNNDFMKYLRIRYNLDVVTDEFVNTQKTLEFDYDLSSLEDVLYFPNLEKLVLGGNRYNLDDTYLEYYGGSKLSDEKASSYALEKISSLLGVEIERYHNHYFSGSFGFIREMGKPTIPELDYFDATNWTIEPSIKDESGYQAHEENLLDNDPVTIWQVNTIQSAPRTHEFTVDMGEEKALDGFKVVQANSMYLYLLPDLVRISLSRDRQNWETAMFFEENTVGNLAGEVTILRTNGRKTARYIKIGMSDKALYGSYGACMADIVPFVDK